LVSVKAIEDSLYLILLLFGVLHIKGVLFMIGNCNYSCCFNEWKGLYILVDRRIGWESENKLN
jgi:hypothetical protein